MSDLSTLKLFATAPHPCSYLDGEEATTVFIDPAADVDSALYTELSQLGFRRSGSHLYRPHCAQCQACLSCRIPVRLFRPNRNQRRCLKRNSDLNVSWIDNIDTDEHYQLYEQYINTRHRDGDMYPPTREQYKAFLSSEWGSTQYIEYRLGDKLAGLAVCDRLLDGLSAVYTFFDPELEKRSLGAFVILQQIAKAQELSLPYVYLGYWIKECPKMNYKTQYRPLELLVNKRWVRLN
ncbi:arginyltransferase [Gilvimarinus agarilyticus]|uniref:arginyltransferase n=1 Tax=unclassified Gilvimarinus TaxID=2642066 RepID=UPI001C091A05|nr:MULTISPECIES: arginyltransferase [unclassified Gilvimarinus]MBU2886425.1 arginyltransferase [Gilvimarinus agarilyticus]MDO6571104.1 arginyltransferase [Gilvimarinus sp. 2_MG-2023]MDO6745648.1 arginyltransferase [Gilvimarinus sp. 1_MG-2023]